MYSSVMTNLPTVAPQYSSLRSSAQAHPHSTTSHSFYMSDYGHQSQPAEQYQDDSSSFSSSPDSIYHDMATHEQSQDYQEPQYAYSTSHADHYRPQIPRSLTWTQDKTPLYHDYPTSQFSPQLQGEGRYPMGYSGGYFDSVPKELSYVSSELGPYYDSPEAALSQERTLTAYTTQEEVLPSVVYSTSGSPRMSAQSMTDIQSGSPPLAYTMHSPSLQYPLTPESGISPRFLRMQDVSPSPTISPDQVYSRLPPHSPPTEYPTSHMGYVPSEASSSSVDCDESLLEILSEVTSARRSSTTDHQPRKRKRRSSDRDSSSGISLDSGESEREEDGDDVDDEEYTPDKEDLPSMRTRRASLRHGNKSAGRSQSPVNMQQFKHSAPIPVPNLTKKSRGRRVPTSAVVVSQNGTDKNIRSYRCKVPGCNKFFQRGEHLKRHVRSIHTNDKPHKCPYRRCNKDFSRNDNLRQHMRVHRNEPLESEDTSA